MDRLYRAEISENLPNGNLVLHVEALVNDKSSGAVSYRLTDQRSSPTTKRVAAFNITDNGHIQVSNSSLLDYENVKEIHLTVIASLAGTRLRTAETAVIVSLDDTNDNRPQFTSQQYTGTISIDDPVGTTIITVSATDADSGFNSMVTYDLVVGDADRPISVTSSGVVILSRSLDASASERYLLTVVAHDDGQPSLSSTASVQVTVQCSSSGRCPLQSQSSESGVSLPVVVGGSVGGVVVITAIVIILVLVVRARRTKKGSRNSNETATPLKSARSVCETNVIENYANPLYQKSHQDEEDVEYESLDDTRRTSSAPLTPPVTSFAENEYTAVRYDSQPDYLEMRSAEDGMEDQLYEDVNTARYDAVYSNAATRL